MMLVGIIILGVIIYLVYEGIGDRAVWSMEKTQITCYYCGNSIEENFNYCPYCRMALKQKCQNCGKYINLIWRNCPYCNYQKSNR